MNDLTIRYLYHKPLILKNTIFINHLNDLNKVNLYIKTMRLFSHISICQETDFVPKYLYTLGMSFIF